MSVKRFLRKGIDYVLNSIAPQTQVYPQVTSLAPNQLLQGRVALITGGTSGIGYSIAKAFIDAGACVIITGRNQNRIDEAIGKLKSETKGEAFGLQLDNTKTDSFEIQFQKAIELVGNRDIDILVNNAGVLGCNFGNAKEEEYDTVLDTNLKGTFFLSQMIAQYMKDRNIHGNILNVASSSSLRPATSAYTVSKWGLRGLTLGMAKILAPYGIVVNGIAPGPTATPMLMRNGITADLSFQGNPSGRYALPEEIAGMSVVLVSNMSRMVIGDIVYMTGGAGLVTLDDVKYNF